MDVNLQIPVQHCSIATGAVRMATGCGEECRRASDCGSATWSAPGVPERLIRLARETAPELAGAYSHGLLRLPGVRQGARCCSGRHGARTRAGTRLVRKPARGKHRAPLRGGSRGRLGRAYVLIINERDAPRKTFAQPAHAPLRATAVTAITASGPPRRHVTKSVCTSARVCVCACVCVCDSLALLARCTSMHHIYGPSPHTHHRVWPSHARATLLIRASRMGTVT